MTTSSFTFDVSDERGYSDEALALGDAIANVRIDHTHFHRALLGVGRIVQVGNRLREPMGMTVVAPAGSGKSLLIDCVERNVCNWPFLRAGSVIVASLKESPNVGQIQTDLLSNFNYAIPPRTTRQTNAAMYNVLVSAIEQHGIKLIALDEFQHVFLSQKEEAHAAVIDWLKRLMSQTRVPVLLSGTEMLRGIEKADPQLWTRVTAIFEIPPFENDEHWRGVLAAFASATRRVDLSALSTTHASSIFRATKGVFRLLKELVVEAAMIALDAKASAVDRQHLGLAFGRMFGDGTSLTNPFA